MAAIKVFLDDTGTDANSPIMGIGGCIATVDAWDRFSYEWSEHLISWGLDWFHMTDAESKKAEYETWTNEHRDSRVGILGRLIECTVICNIGVLIPSEPFKQVVTDKIASVSREMARTEGDPYFHAFKLVHDGIERVCTLGNIANADVEIVFAEQKGIGPRSRDAWRELLAKGGFPEPVFRSPQRIPPLQAADMVAWFIHNWAKSGRPPRQRHKPLTRNLLFSPVTADIISQLSRAFDDAVRESMSSDDVESE